MKTIDSVDLYLILEKNNTLAQAYKKRLDGFLLSIIEKPI